MIINGYTVTSNSYSRNQEASVYVKREGVIYCKLRLGTINNPLGVIQKNPRAPERQLFIDTLLGNGVSAEDVEQLLKPVPSRYFLKKMEKMISEKQQEK